MRIFKVLFFVVFTIIFVGSIVSMVLGGFWNYQLYKECLADGHKSYQCKAMIENGGYVAVETMGN